MDSLHKDPILTFPPDILKAVRKEYDLDKPGAMDMAIDILELWLKQQDHFTKKDFRLDGASYLEHVLNNGYGLRVKQVHVVSPSKLVNVLVSTFKQYFSEKLASRIQIHSDLETLHQYVDKDIMPEECGGTDSSLKEMYNKWADVLSSEDFLSYIKETYEYKINESLRPLTTQNDELGLAGTFRSLSVD